MKRVKQYQHEKNTPGTLVTLLSLLMSVSVLSVILRGLSVYNRKLLQAKDEGGKQSDLTPRARKNPQYSNLYSLP